MMIRITVLQVVAAVGLFRLSSSDIAVSVCAFSTRTIPRPHHQSATVVTAWYPNSSSSSNNHNNKSYLQRHHHQQHHHHHHKLPPGQQQRRSKTSTTVVTATVAESSSSSSSTTFTSTGAKQQIGNDSFLNQNLMARAQNGPGQINQERLDIAIVGAGLAGLVAAMDLADAGHSVTLYETRPFVGGKVSSWVDKQGNHIEMGLHVFFGCYYNLFGIMKRTGAFDTQLRMKEHTHTFVNQGGKLGSLDFRFPIGAPVSGLQAFFKTQQLSNTDKVQNAIRLGTSPIVRALIDFDGGMDMVRDLDDISFTTWFQQYGAGRGSLDRMWDAIAYALGFLDCNSISARCMLTIFMLFAIRTEASVLRMLDGSPQTSLHDPILQYLHERNVTIHLSTPIRDLVYDVSEIATDDGTNAGDRSSSTTTTTTTIPTHVRGVTVGPKEQFVPYDVVVAAVDVPGIKKLLPVSFRSVPFFDKIYNLDTVPIATVQLRFDGWVTELNDNVRMKDVTTGDQSDGRGAGIDNLLYSVDAEFSCFADLALTSPGDYYKPGEGSLIQAVFDERAFHRSNEQLVTDCLTQIRSLFPSSHLLNCTWSNVVKLGQSLYREKPGQDKFRPAQATPIPNFFLSGSYTYQDYLDSMEGATRSGLMVADEIIAKADGPKGLKAQAQQRRQQQQRADTTTGTTTSTAAVAAPVVTTAAATTSVSSSSS